MEYKHHLPILWEFLRYPLEKLTHITWPQSNETAEFWQMKVEPAVISPSNSDQYKISTT